MSAQNAFGRFIETMPCTGRCSSDVTATAKRMNVVR